MIYSGIQQPLIENGRVKVQPETPRMIPCDYYMYILKETLTITTSTVIGNTEIEVASTTGVSAGDAVTFYENDYMYQSIVKSTETTPTRIVVSSPIDNVFTASAIVETGTWNLVVDGSSSAKKAYIKSPPNANIDIHSIQSSMLDDVAMSDDKFGGISALTNGIYFRFDDGFVKNLALIVNNIGFWEIGFQKEYADKAPANKFGVAFRRNIPEQNGTTLLLDCTTSAEFQLWIQDDLEDLEQFTCVVSGHIEACE